MASSAPMLRLSPDGQRVLDQHGTVVYEAHRVGDRTIFAPAGTTDGQLFCPSVGVKMACRRWDERGECQDWATIDVCVAWPEAAPRRPMG